MALETKTRQDEILDEIMNKIEGDLASVPEPERSERIKAAVEYGALRWPSRTKPRKNGNHRSPERS
jgi:hypothetical protein